jgi:hypothetical protein|tara:strand:+ start:38 stop:928 length:891 start_codon:yes stop_codon:yes gene_type:complete
MQKFKLILELLKKVYGSRFIQNFMGTRTNVTKLPGKNDPRKAMYDMNKLADDTGALMLAKEKVKELAPFITKMNDSELKMYETNLKGIAQAENKLDPIETIDTSEVIDIKTGKKMDDKGIASLKDQASGDKGGIGMFDDIFKAMMKDPFIIKNIDELRRPGGALDPATGITRAGARLVLEKNNIKIGSKDPLDLFRENFGQDALIDLNNVSEELLEIDRRGGTYGDMTKILEREGFMDMPINRDAPQGMTDEELAELIRKEDDRVAKDEDAIREIIDPEDPPTKKASGGLAGVLGV